MAEELRCLTDSRLAQIAQARYQALMLLEVNGGQYSGISGAREAVDEQKRRQHGDEE